MSKKKLAYFLIMAILFIGNMYLVYAFLLGESFVLIAGLSLLIAILSRKIAKWIVDKLFGNDPQIS